MFHSFQLHFIGKGSLTWKQAFSLQVAVNHNNCGCIIVQITDNYRHGLFFCQLTGSAPPVSGYQLIAALRVWSGNRRNQNAILLDTVSGLHHGFVILDFEWMVPKGMQFRQRNFLNLFQHFYPIYPRHLDIAEKRVPQDGRIKTRVKGRELDLRVSTVPTVHGESVVMRVLDRASVRLNLDTMGFEQDTLVRFNALLARPHGILLVTGPTGSGKTTTLYAALSKIDAQANKIITVEDPVEYQLEGINQIQVHPQINLTFANALRSILRQDPDIIMIGEMRDGETAQIAVQSALTGHLVLSTLHTNTAAGAVIRMQDMGVESYLITSSVNGVLAQRLVRTLCGHCKEAYEPGPEVRQSTGLARFCPPERPIYRAVGCEHCRQSGYRGRTGIHELFVLDEPMRRAIIEGRDANALNTIAAQGGMLSLFEDGLRKVAAGATTLDELARVTQDQSDA